MRTHWAIHPFLVGLFPIIFLYAHNAQETSARELLLPVGVVFVVTFALWLVLSLVFRSWQKTGLIVSLLLIVFFSSNHLNQLLNKGLTELSRLWVYQGIEIKPIYLLATECLVLVCAAYLILRKLRRHNEVTNVLNLFSLLLVCMPTASVLLSMKEAPAALAHAAPKAPPVLSDALPAGSRPAKLPDIYYIILDGYARSDKMRELFGFDNEPFLKCLERRGFYVARESRANYCQTPLCLASSLNFQYLDDLSAVDPQQIPDRLKERIGNNTTASTLKRLGYQFVTFSTGFDQTDHLNADTYLTPHPNLSAFQWMLLSTTPLANLTPRQTTVNPYDLARERTLFLLKTLPDVAKYKAPTFTFAHIICPHPPFVFGENGEDVSPHGKLFQLTDGDQFQRIYGDRDNYIQGYRNQAIFITKQVDNMIGRILANSPEPPIIILQSDHGSGLGLNIFCAEKTDLSERMSILNAYYLPDRGNEHLYQTITPVNSFRVVLNKYFGGKLDLLPDQSFYSSWPEPTNFTNVTDDLADKPEKRVSLQR
ncbi:MAG TPA: hypothetical protein VGZ22_30775 [Isosphaeraceae bacterium]|jgi:hypothetical protein|nr:hypothetical protein [Isosphaeraceae bacterium]